MPFHIFPPIITVTTYKREIITKFQCQNCSLDFSSLIACLFALHVSAPMFQQLTKLHQLAMQQSPFPIAHGNQGCFQGRSTDWKHLLSICNNLSRQHTLSLCFFSWDGCLCTDWLSWDDHSKRCKSRLCSCCVLRKTAPFFIKCSQVSCCLYFFLTSHAFLSFSSSAASSAARVQRSMRSVRCQGLRSRLPTLWRAPLTDMSPSPALTPVSAWLNTWSAPGESEAKHPSQSRKLTWAQLLTAWNQRTQVLLCSLLIVYSTSSHVLHPALHHALANLFKWNSNSLFLLVMWCNPWVHFSFFNLFSRFEIFYPFLFVLEKNNQVNKIKQQVKLLQE